MQTEYNDGYIEGIADAIEAMTKKLEKTDKEQLIDALEDRSIYVDSF